MAQQLSKMWINCWSLAVCALGVAAIASAQDDVRAPQKDANVEKLDGITRRMASYIESLPAYQVHVAQDWQLAGKSAAKGHNQFTLSVQHDKGFRLEVGTSKDKAAELVCSSDGKQITRVLHIGDRYIHSLHPGGLQQLLQCSLTESSVRYSGLDVLCRERPERYMMVMASNVKYLGVTEMASQSAHHFTMNWGHGNVHQVELWIAAGDAPAPLKTVQKIRIQVGPELESDLLVTTNLKWNKGMESLEGELQVETPAKSTRVADLHGHLIQGGAAKLVGKLPPSIPLKLLNGGDWKLSSNKKVVVLYFFATWAIPSHREKQAIIDLLNEIDSKDVELMGISVGEDLKTVQAFATSKKYEHLIALDPERTAAAAFNVTSLPTVVVIGKDHKVEAAFVGNSDEVRGVLKNELARLLSGKNRVAERP